jgi:hypothetical protein
MQKRNNIDTGNIYIEKNKKSLVINNLNAFVIIVSFELKIFSNFIVYCRHN